MHTGNPTGEEIEAPGQAGVRNPVTARTLGAVERALAPEESSTTLA
jgi:hypothetical protein